MLDDVAIGIKDGVTALWTGGIQLEPLVNATAQAECWWLSECDNAQHARTSSCLLFVEVMATATRQVSHLVAILVL